MGQRRQGKCQPGQKRQSPRAPSQKLLSSGCAKWGSWRSRLIIPKPRQRPKKTSRVAVLCSLTQVGSGLLSEESLDNETSLLPTSDADEDVNAPMSAGQVSRRARSADEDEQLET